MIDPGPDLPAALGVGQEGQPEFRPFDSLHQPFQPAGEQRGEHRLLVGRQAERQDVVTQAGADEHGGFGHLPGQGAPAPDRGLARRHEAGGRPGQHGVDEGAPVGKCRYTAPRETPAWAATSVIDRRERPSRAGTARPPPECAPPCRRRPARAAPAGSGWRSLDWTYEHLRSFCSFGRNDSGGDHAGTAGADVHRDRLSGIGRATVIRLMDEGALVMEPTSSISMHLGEDHAGAAGPSRRPTWPTKHPSKHWCGRRWTSAASCRAWSTWAGVASGGPVPHAAHQGVASGHRGSPGPGRS